MEAHDVAHSPDCLALFLEEIRGRGAGTVHREVARAADCSQSAGAPLRLGLAGDVSGHIEAVISSISSIRPAGLSAPMSATQSYHSSAW